MPDFEPETIARQRRRKKPPRYIDPWEITIKEKPQPPLEPEPKIELPKFEPETIARAKFERPPPPPEEPPEGASLLERIYPERFAPGYSYGYTPEELEFVVADQIETQAREDPEAFLEDLLSRGRTPDTEALLLALGATEEDIETIFAPPKPFEIPQEGLQFVEEVEGIRRVFTVRPDYSVELEGKTIGIYNLETGTIEPLELTTYELAKENLEVAWDKLTTMGFCW